MQRSAAESCSPRVTIGLPVFNGARYLHAAMDSILAQTFTDFELVVSDNASTDDSADICQALAARDKRIRLIRQPANLGAARNHNLLFEQARGEYFKWAAHDDLLDPDFVARCVAELDRCPEAVAAFTGTRVIDESGCDLGQLDVDYSGLAAPAVSRRVRTALATDRWCVDLFGVFRTTALARTSLIPGYVGSDRILRVELVLNGPIIEVPETLFSSRDHAGRSTRAMPAHHLRGAWYDPTLRGKRLLPHWRIFGEYLMSVWRRHLMSTDRARCLLAVFGWLLRDANVARMLADPVIALWPGSWRVFYALSRSGERWLPRKQAAPGR